MPSPARVLLTVALLWPSAIAFAGQAATGDPVLTYDEPAAAWTAALPVGNGRIGAMVFGGTEHERLQINESTLWGGGPHDYSNPDALRHVDEVRRLIFAGRIEEAERTSAQLMGTPSMLMPYQPFGDLRLHFPGHARATAYRRELRLQDAVVTTSYSVEGTTFTREVFASYPDQVLVVRLSADRPGRLTFTVGMDSPHPGTVVEGSDGGLRLTGQIQPRQNPPRTWIGSWDRPGMRFAAVLRVTTDGGSIRHRDEGLEVTSADAATILFSNATSFRSFLDIGADAAGLARSSRRANRRCR